VDAEGDLHVAVALPDRLRHEQLVEIGVDHRADDRIDLPSVIVDAGGDVDHRGTVILIACGSSRHYGTGRRCATRGGSVEPMPMHAFKTPPSED
jgi:hypothetical protein